jgi:hypothetical protein
VTLVSLFDVEPVEEPLTLQDRFESFHRQNLNVYIELRKLALEWVDAGHDHCGLSMLFEVLRWQHGLRTSGEKFLLNNDFRAPYARLLMQNEPRLAGLFETRRSVVDE